MFQCGSSTLTSFPWVKSNHIDQSGVEPFTLTIGLWMIQTGPYLLHSHQLTEVSHQLILKVVSLIHQNLFGETVVDNKFVPQGLCHCLCHLGSCNICLSIPGEMVCYH